MLAVELIFKITLETNLSGVGVGTIRLQSGMIMKTIGGQQLLPPGNSTSITTGRFWHLVSIYIYGNNWGEPERAPQSCSGCPSVCLTSICSMSVRLAYNRISMWKILILLDHTAWYDGGPAMFCTSATNHVLWTWNSRSPWTDGLNNYLATYYATSLKCRSPNHDQR